MDWQVKLRGANGESRTVNAGIYPVMDESDASVTRVQCYRVEASTPSGPSLSDRVKTIHDATARLRSFFSSVEFYGQRWSLDKLDTVESPNTLKIHDYVASHNNCWPLSDWIRKNCK